MTMPKNNSLHVSAIHAQELLRKGSPKEALRNLTQGFEISSEILMGSVAAQLIEESKRAGRPFRPEPLKSPLSFGQRWRLDLRQLEEEKIFTTHSRGTDQEAVLWSPDQPGSIVHITGLQSTHEKWYAFTHESVEGLIGKQPDALHPPIFALQSLSSFIDRRVTLGATK